MKTFFCVLFALTFFSCSHQNTNSSQRFPASDISRGTQMSIIKLADYLKTGMSLPGGCIIDNVEAFEHGEHDYPWLTSFQLTVRNDKNGFSLSLFDTVTVLDSDNGKRFVYEEKTTTGGDIWFLEKSIKKEFVMELDKNNKVVSLMMQELRNPRFSKKIWKVHSGIKCL